LERQDEAREERFRELVHRQSRFVFHVAYVVLRNASDAEDVVQETFFKLYRIGTWTAMRDEKAFLARTAWRIAVERLPKRKQEELDFEIASADASPEARAIVGDSNALVHRMIDALPEVLRQPLALSALEELSSPEIALVMGIPEGTVRTRLMRARALLREKLAAVMDGRYAK
jgi:RNA polymerase sigma-70 factor (ECF subfamily)